MIIIKFIPDSALTIPISYISEKKSGRGFHSRLHVDGWHITGKIESCSHTWANYFVAHHPIFGAVYGDFEKEVFADTKEGFQDFYSKYPPEAWDYSELIYL